MHGRFGAGPRAADCLSSLLRRSAGNTHLRLDDVDGLGHISKRVDVERGASELTGISQQPLHLGLRTAITELQVVQHIVVLLGKALIRVLDGSEVGAHLVRVVGHVRDGLICHVRSKVGITAERVNQARGKTGHEVHVLVARHTGGLEGVCCILLHLP